MVKIGSGVVAPIVVASVASLALVTSCIVYPCARSLNRRRRLPRMGFNLPERTEQARRPNQSTNTDTAESTNRSASGPNQYDKDLALAIERSLKTSTIEGDPAENNNSSQHEGLRHRVPAEMHGALAPGEEPKSDPLETISTPEVAIVWQTPVHDTTPVSGGEDDVTNPESSRVREREEEGEEEDEQGSPVPEKDNDGDKVSVRDWAYQPGFTSDGRAKGKGKAIG